MNTILENTGTKQQLVSIQNFVLGLLEDAAGSIDPSNRVGTPAAKEAERKHAAQALNLAAAVIRAQVDLTDPKDAAELRGLYLAALRQRDIVNNLNDAAIWLKEEPEPEADNAALHKGITEQLDAAYAELNRLRRQSVDRFGVCV